MRSGRSLALAALLALAAPAAATENPLADLRTPGSFFHCGESFVVVTSGDAQVLIRKRDIEWGRTVHVEGIGEMALLHYHPERTPVLVTSETWVRLISCLE